MILYVVGTPIGNMGDITYRAVETLKQCDVILCEDTRCSIKMLNHYGIKKQLISYHKFNEFRLLDQIIFNIKNGVKYALISDAGMPCISDPGQILVNRCIEENIKIDVIPGVCAAINGKILSGFKDEMFTFIGFLPRAPKKLKYSINLMKSIHTILIVYESPHRLIDTLNLFKEEFGGDTLIYIGRELTKLFEENFRGSIEEALSYFNESKIRGEFLICIENNIKEEIIDDNHILNEYRINNKNGFTDKDNIKMICTKYNLKKNYVYKLILKEKNLT